MLNQKDDIETLLAQLNRDRYPLSVLRQRPLPDGVNPLKLECYLIDEEFEVNFCLFLQSLNRLIKLKFNLNKKELLKITKDEFFNLPSWKQTNLKKKANLF